MNTKVNYHLLGYIGLSLCLSLSACTNSRVYVPSTNHVPLVKNKGDVSFNLNGTSTFSHNQTIGLDLAAAINITGPIGIGVYSTNYDNPSTYLEEDYHRHSYKELSLIINPFKTKEDIYAEFMVSYGRGEGKERGRDCGPYAYECQLEPMDYGVGKYDKYSLQFAYAEDKGRFQTGMTMKMSYLDYYFLDKLEYDTQKSSKALFYEPAFFVRYGFKYAKLDFQTGITTALLQSTEFNYSKYFASLGILVSLEKIF